MHEDFSGLLKTYTGQHDLAEHIAPGCLFALGQCIDQNVVNRAWNAAAVNHIISLLSILMALLSILMGKVFLLRRGKLRVPLRLICFFCALVLFTVLPGGVALAHVDSDSMPDSVAEIEYRIYLEFRPNDVVVLNKLGMVYYRQGKLTDAQRQFAKVLKVDPDNYDALDGLGLVKTAQQQYDEAIMYHRRAIELNVEDMVGYFHLGNAFEKKGMLQEAIEAYNAALEKFNRQYPGGSKKKKAAEFFDKVRTAIDRIETNQK